MTEVSKLLDSADLVVFRSCIYHREKSYTDFLAHKATDLLKTWRIGRIEVCIILLDDGWYIAELLDHKKQFKDIGPFETPELAILALRLLQN